MLKPHDTFIRAGTLLEQYEGRGKIDEIKRGGTRRDKSGEAMPSGEAKPRAALLCRHDETISSYSSGSERRSGPAINIPRPSAAAERLRKTDYGAAATVQLPAAIPALPLAS